MAKSNIPQMPRYSMREFFMAAAIIICVAAYPILYIYANNAALIDPADVLLLLLLDILISLAAGAIITVLVRDLFAATIIAAALNILFFTYGHVYLLLVNDSVPAVAFFGNDLVLAPIWLAILVLVIVLALRYRQSLPRAMSSVLIVSLALVVLQVIQIGAFVVARNQTARAAPNTQSANVATERPRVNPAPDVYYIILDGYGRDDTLKQNFDFDNSEFIDGLKQRGFYVAEQSYSNYPMTYVSVSSTLNMDYHTETEIDGDPAMVTAHFQDLISRSVVRQAFIAMGYDLSRNKTAPENLSQDQSPENISYLFDTEFFYIVRKSSLLSILSSSEPASEPSGAEQPEPDEGSSEKSTEIETRMRWMSAYAQDHVPTFVYAHYLSPHPPYDFTTTGLEKSATKYESSQWLDHDAYVREIKALNPIVLQAVDEILAHSETPPIIIIQGDHGPSTKFFEHDLKWNTQASNLADQMPGDIRQERYAILNAYYGPPEIVSRLYPGISPVNSFRIILSYISNHDYPLLPDRSYMTTPQQPIEYIELTDLHPDTP